MSRGQTLDVWLDQMNVKSRSYEKEITQINNENLDWVKSWAQTSKRTLENYLEVPNKKRFKASNSSGDETDAVTVPLSEISDSSGNIAASQDTSNNQNKYDSATVKKSKRKSAEDTNDSEVKRRKSSEVEQILNSNTSSKVFDMNAATVKVSKLKVTEIREELKILGCTGKSLRGRKAQLVKKIS